MSERDTRLEIGGSVGSRRGNLAETHFKTIVERMGYIVVKGSGWTSSKKRETDDGDKICVHRFRMPPSRDSEIDFFFPKERVGIWVTYIGRIDRLRCPNAACDLHGGKFNELRYAVGICPHCKNEKLPKVIKGKKLWVCSEGNNLVDPLDLIDLTCSRCGANLEWYKDTSASIQAHKQFYYRFAELLDIKTIEKKTSCIFVSYSTRQEWRLWWKTFNFFFDYSVFLDDLPSPFGSPRFDSQTTRLLLRWLSDPPLNQNPLWLSLLHHKISRRKSMESCLRELLSRHSKRDKPRCFPIRYAIYEILMKMKEKEESWPSNVEKAYANAVSLVPKYDSKHYPSEVIQSILQNIKERNLNHGWSKYKMIANLSVEQLDRTPFVPGFEPLEELLFLKLQDWKEEGVINDYREEPCVDVPCETFLKDIPQLGRAEKGIAQKLGQDAWVLLPNGKEILFQCKTSASFKKFKQTGNIDPSGIAYKDSKRMIGHSTLILYSRDDQILKKDENRLFVTIIDGNWRARKAFKLITFMYLLAADEIFYGDEIVNGTLRAFLKKEGTK